MSNVLSDVNKLAIDSTKNIAVFINDFNQEFADALEKLSRKLNRPLHGIILIDSGVKERKRNSPDKANVFEHIVCDFSDDAALRAVVKKFEKNLLLVGCSSERNQPYLQRVLPHVPYIFGPTESSLDWATHKATMRKLLGNFDSHISPKSETVLRDSEEEISRILKDLEFPMIVKPNGLAKSTLVKRVNDETELRDTLDNAFKHLDELYARDSGRGEPSMIVEEFMEGDMYSIDAYANQTGKVWCLPCIKVTTADSIGLEGFYSYRNDTNHGLSDDDVKAAQETATKAMHALGLRSCASHIELFKTPNGWKIIELSARAGGYRQDMYWYGYGIDHAYNELLVKIGLEPEITYKPSGYCAIFNMYANQEGTISKIRGVEEANKIPSVKWTEVYRKPGDEAIFCGNGGEYIVDGVLSNDTFEGLDKDMNELRRVLTIEVKN